jgi:hypothetical protein
VKLGRDRLVTLGFSFLFESITRSGDFGWLGEYGIDAYFRYQNFSPRFPHAQRNTLDFSLTNQLMAGLLMHAKNSMQLNDISRLNCV